MGFGDFLLDRRAKAGDWNEGWRTLAASPEVQPPILSISIPSLAADDCLADNKKGKPSPTYKRIKVVLDQFVNEVQGDDQKEKEFENMELQTHTKWLGSLS